MSSFTFELDAEAGIEAGSSNGGVVATGVYDVVINHASVGKSKNGNNTVDISFTTSNNQSGMIWGLCMDKQWVSGSENFDYPKWQEFAQVCGMKTGETVPFKLSKDDGTPILKDGKQVELNVFKELHGVKIKLATQVNLDFYRGEVTEKNKLYASFLPDGSTLGGIAGKADKVASRLTDKETQAYKARNETSYVVQEEEAEPQGSLLD